MKQYYQSYIYINSSTSDDAKFTGKPCFRYTNNNICDIFYVPIFCSMVAAKNYIKFLNDIGVGEKFEISLEKVPNLCEYKIIWENINTFSHKLLFLTFTRYLGEFSTLVDEIFTDYSVDVTKKWQEFVAAHFSNRKTINDMGHALISVKNTYNKNGLTDSNLIVDLEEFRARLETIRATVYKYLEK